MKLTKYFLQGLNNEDNSNQWCEGLLCKSCKVPTFIKNKKILDCQVRIMIFWPDDGRAIHGHDDDAEQGGPEPDPEPDGEVGHPVGEAEVHQDLLEDEDGPSAAQDGEGLPGEQAEHAPGQQVAQEWLQHALGHSAHLSGYYLTWISPEGRLWCLRGNPQMLSPLWQWLKLDREWIEYKM